MPKLATQSHQLLLAALLSACGSSPQMLFERQNQVKANSSEESHSEDVRTEVITPGTPIDVQTRSETKADTPPTERITPPTQVTGTYLQAIIIDEDRLGVDTSEIGLAVYQNGVRVASQPVVYSFEMMTSASPDPAVTVSMRPSSRSEFDMVLVMEGESLDRIRELYGEVFITLNLVDMQKVASTSMSRSVLSLLQQSGSLPRN